MRPKTWIITLVSLGLIALGFTPLIPSGDRGGYAIAIGIGIVLGSALGIGLMALVDSMMKHAEVAAVIIAGASLIIFLVRAFLTSFEAGAVIGLISAAGVAIMLGVHFRRAKTLPQARPHSREGSP